MNKMQERKSICHAEFSCSALSHPSLSSGLSQRGIVHGPASSGRSMIEMLGVLAVIGVLSIGGLAGYSKAMTYHRANSILSDVQLAYAWMVGIEEIEEGDHKPGFVSQSGKEIYAFRTGSGDDFVKVVGVEESTCERLLNMQGDKLYIYEGNSKMTKCSETNTMTFGFNQFAPNDSGKDTPTTPTCDSDETLLNGKCCENDRVCGTGTNQVCCGYGTCQNGLCVTEDGTTCAEGETVVEDFGGVTRCCPNNSSGYADFGGCCDADENPLYDSASGMSSCCPANSTGYADRCCTANEKVIYDDIMGDNHCCSSDSTGYAVSSGCCDADEKVVEFNDDRFCCKADSTGYSADEGCCPAGTVVFNEGGYGACCPEGTNDLVFNHSLGRSECCGANGSIVLSQVDTGHEYCCPANSTGYGDRCCTANEKVETDENGDGHCCSSDSTGYGDRCCRADEKVLWDVWSNRYCCSLDSSDVASNGDCCDANEKAVEDSGGETTCCPNATVSYDDDQMCCVDSAGNCLD